MSPTKTTASREIVDLDTDDLRAELDRRDTRTVNIADAEYAAGRAAEISEARRRYREAIDAAQQDFDTANAELGRLVHDRAGIAELHAAFLAVKLADARRYAISSRAAGDMNSIDPLPPNALAAAPQSRAAIQRDWRDTDFHGFLLRVEEQWAAEETTTVDQQMREAMQEIVDTAKAAAKAEAEANPDGYLEVEVPELFAQRYATALAELDHEPTTNDRSAIQQQLLLEETGGRRPTIT